MPGKVQHSRRSDTRRKSDNQGNPPLHVQQSKESSTQRKPSTQGGETITRWESEMVDLTPLSVGSVVARRVLGLGGERVSNSTLENQRKPTTTRQNGSRRTNLDPNRCAAVLSPRPRSRRPIVGPLRSPRVAGPGLGVSGSRGEASGVAYKRTYKPSASINPRGQHRR